MLAARVWSGRSRAHGSWQRIVRLITSQVGSVRGAEADADASADALVPSPRLVACRSTGSAADVCASSSKLCSPGRGSRGRTARAGSCPDRSRAGRPWDSSGRRDRSTPPVPAPVDGDQVALLVDVVEKRTAVVRHRSPPHPPHRPHPPARRSGRGRVGSWAPEPRPRASRWRRA